MAWSEQMPFESPVLTSARARLEKLEAEYNHTLMLSRSKTRKTRLAAKKALPGITNAVLRAGLDLDKAS